MEDFKYLIRDLFDNLSTVYDNENLRFFNSSSQRMIELLDLKGDEKLIDIAAGTGQVSIKACEKLNNGSVHATDLSSKMLDVIKSKASTKGLKNISFEVCDMESLMHSDEYDAATCAFGIFFIANMVNGLKKIGKTVKPGGKVAITTFNQNYFHPMSDLFYTRLKKYGVERKSSNWEQINTPEATKNLLEEAGYNNIQITKEQHGYFLKNSNAWWKVIINAGMRFAFEQLKDEHKEDFIKEHLEEIQQLSTEKGIWMDVEIIFAVAQPRYGELNEVKNNTKPGQKK